MKGTLQGFVNISSEKGGADMCDGGILTEPNLIEVDVISQFVSRHNKVPAYTAGKILQRYDIDTIKFREKYLKIGTDEWGCVVYAVKPDWVRFAKKLKLTERFKNWVNDLVE